MLEGLQLSIHHKNKHKYFRTMHQAVDPKALSGPPEIDGKLEIEYARWQAIPS